MNKQATKVIPVDRAELEVELGGSGELIVLIQTALIADELRLLADQPAVRNGYRTVLYHRRVRRQ